jgi:hypothetical protein
LAPAAIDFQEDKKGRAWDVVKYKRDRIPCRGVPE